MSLSTPTPNTASVEPRHSVFAGQSVLITGASRGLGGALFSALARAGALVVGVARELGPLDAAAARLRSEGYVAHAVPGDVGNRADIYPIAGAAAALVGAIDILVHNASTLGPTPLPLLLDTACEDFARVLEVNLLGPFRLSKAIAGNMLLRGSGSVVHISSDAAVAAYPRWGAYGVSKAALDHLNRVWAAEFAHTGVRFLSIDPGEMDTEMHRAAVPDADPATLAQPELVAEQILRLLARPDLRSGERLDATQLGRAAEEAA
jgi:NAD(P)-dependent dehydrogenase (short-subunit alcohol dehydrogenase family)